MEYRFMGRTGLRVSELCLGIQTFGWGADEPTAHALADRFVEAGGNFFDTSNIYNEGRSESMAGLLREAASRGLAPEYVESLLAAFDTAVLSDGEEPPPGAHLQPLMEPLSDRELEVLGLL